MRVRRCRCWGRRSRTDTRTGVSWGASSEPWKTLRERVDFAPFIRKKQAFVAVIAGALAGFVVFTPEPVFARGGYLRAIGVAPSIRGAGIGRKLLAFAEKATAKQAPNFYLCVSSFNKEGQTFYRKCGYKKVGAVDGLIRKDSPSEHISLEEAPEE